MPRVLSIDLSFITIIANFVCEGILGQAQGHPHPDGGGVHVHERPAISSTTQTKHGPQQRMVRVDSLHKVGAGTRPGDLRMSDFHHTYQVVSVSLKRRW